MAANSNPINHVYNQQTVTANDPTPVGCGTKIDAAIGNAMTNLIGTPPANLAGGFGVVPSVMYFDGTNYQAYAVITWTTLDPASV